MRPPCVGDWIALYGSLLRGLGGLEAAGASEGLRLVGPCTISGQLFDLGDYPGLRPGTGVVIGEIHALLEPSALDRLDRFEDFDSRRPQASLYVRERTMLLEPAGREAWLYVYNRVPDLSQRVEGGDWRAHLEARATRRAPIGTLTGRARRGDPG